MVVGKGAGRGEGEVGGEGEGEVEGGVDAKPFLLLIESTAEFIGVDFVKQ